MICYKVSMNNQQPRKHLKIIMWTICVTAIALIAFGVFRFFLYPKMNVNSTYNQIKIPASLQLQGKEWAGHERSWMTPCATYTYGFTGLKDDAVRSLKNAVTEAGYEFEISRHSLPVWANTADSSVAISSLADDTISLSVSDRQTHAWCGGGVVPGTRAKYCCS